MGMDELNKFNINEKIIEYVMAEKTSSGLCDLTIEEFMYEVASESPAPGGGSVSAYLGSLGVALGTMVANLSSHKRGWDERWEEFSDWAEKGMELQKELLDLVDEDTSAYNKLLAAFSLPNKSEAEKELRKNAVTEATRVAIVVPFRVMEIAVKGFDLIKEMVTAGNPNSVSDAGVGALALRACIRGAYMNVRINTAGFADKEFVNKFLINGSAIEKGGRNERRRDSEFW